jgi:hypothetical protein
VADDEAGGVKTATNLRQNARQARPAGRLSVLCISIANARRTVREPSRWRRVRDPAGRARA